jgi:hypothetical protein
VTYAAAGRSGSIDILAWHPASATLLVLEVKTAIASGEATLRKLDEKVRIASALARERFGWTPSARARLLAIEDTSTNRRRVGANSAFFEAALPVSGTALRRWLAAPAASIDGLLFLSSSDHAAVIQSRGGQHRVRRRASITTHPAPSVGWDESGRETLDDRQMPTVLVGYERRGR